MMEELKVSVVVTVLNEADGTSMLLAALTRQTKQPDEIIVVDGGSTDGTPAVVEKYMRGGHAIRLLCESGCNISQGRNFGIKSARHEIIACTDAGCIPNDTWLAELTDPFQDAKIAVVGGACQVNAHSRLEQVMGLMTVPGELNAIEPISYNPSARNIAFRKSAWRRVGGFPEWLYTAEDTLFDCKLRKIGVGFSYAPMAKVRWRPRQSMQALWRQISGYAQGEGHIGRAGESSRFWRRRYAVTFCIVLACLASAYTLSSIFLAVVGFAAAAILLMAPLSLKACRVANRTGRMTDYLLAILVGQVMALADAVGFARGTTQRLLNPERFITPLKAYWGEAKVDGVPKWQLVSSPTPKTLIVSWHWAPNGRACANVLSNLFMSAGKEAFSVITRSVPPPSKGDDIATPSMPTHRVPWPTWSTQESGLVFILASIWTVLRMIRRAMLLQRERTFDRTMAVYPHRFSLLAGLLISIVTGTKLVIYMHDLLAESVAGRGVIHRTIWRLIDRIVLNRAWFIVVPTREFADHYRRRGLSNTVVIPHCLPAKVNTILSESHPHVEQPATELTSYSCAEPRALARAVAKNKSNRSNVVQQGVPCSREEKCINESSSVVSQEASTSLESAQAKACGSGRNQSLRLVYAGKVYEAHEDAIRALVEATNDLDAVELTMLSNAHTVTQSEQPTWMSRRKALRAIGQADVAVVALGMQTPYPTEISGCFPSKIIDYIVTGRPILAIVPPGCFVDRFVRESGCGVTVESFSIADIQAAIEKLSDLKARERMTEAAIAVRCKLAAPYWMAQLNHRLTIGFVTDIAMPIVSKQASDTLWIRANSTSFELESGVGT